MFKFDPAFTITSLSATDPGSLVRIDKKYGFSGVHGSGPGRAAVLYNTETYLFDYFFGRDPEIINFGKDLVIAPTLDAYGSLIPDADVSNELFIHDGSPMVSCRAGNTFCLLNLNSGAIIEVHSKLALSRFGEWQVGLRGAQGQFSSLLDVTRNPRSTWARLAE